MKFITFPLRFFRGKGLVRPGQSFLGNRVPERRPRGLRIERLVVWAELKAPPKKGGMARRS